jgi:hypothetical protein
VATQSISLTLLPIALLFDLYALRVYFIRTHKIKSRSEERWDDAMGPVLLASLFLLALIAEFIIRVRLHSYIYLFLSFQYFYTVIVLSLGY